LDYCRTDRRRRASDVETKQNVAGTRGCTGQDLSNPIEDLSLFFGCTGMAT